MTGASARPAPLAVLSSGAGLLVLHGTVAGLAFAYSVVVARLLPPPAYGEYVVGVSLATLLTTTLWPLGLVNAQLVASFAARSRWTMVRRLQSTLIGITIRWGVPAAAVLAILSIPAARWLHFSSPLPLATTALLFLALVATALPRTGLRGLALYRAYGAALLVESVVRLTAGGLMSAWTRNATGALIGSVVAAGSGAIVGFVALRRVLPPADGGRIHPARIRSLLGPGMLLLSFVSAWQYVDLVLVKAIFAAEPAGVYAAAHVLSRAALIVGMTLDAIFLPALTRSGLSGRATRAALLRLYGLFGAIAGTLLALFAIAGAWITRTLFGSDYGIEPSLLVILTLSSFTTYAAYLAGQGLMALRRPAAIGAWGVLLVVTALVARAGAASPQDVAVRVAIGSALGFLILCGTLLAETRETRTAP